MQPLVIYFPDNSYMEVGPSELRAGHHRVTFFNSEGVPVDIIESESAMHAIAGSAVSPRPENFGYFDDPMWVEVEARLLDRAGIFLYTYETEEDVSRISDTAILPDGWGYPDTWVEAVFPQSWPIIHEHNRYYPPTGEWWNS